MKFWRLINEARVLASSGEQRNLSEVVANISQYLDALSGTDRSEKESFFRQFLSTYKVECGFQKGESQLSKSIVREAKVSKNINISLDSYVEKVGEGVSLVTCCMNRNENLSKALASWIACDTINEIIVVDWSSNEPVREYLNSHGYNDSRIKVLRIDGQPRWILSYAFNIGFRTASYDKILKTDADIIVHPNFFQTNILTSNIFISGDWRVAEKGQEHINGFFYVSRKNLMNIKAFNEYITTYGWDDDDIYNRLELSGVKRTQVDLKTIYHIPHDDALRIGEANDMFEYLDSFHSTTKFKIRVNRFITNVMPTWNKDRVFFPVNIIKQGQGYLALKQNGESIHSVPDHIRDDAEYYAELELTSWRVGLRSFELDRKDLRKLLSAKPHDLITRLDVEVAIHNKAISFEFSLKYLVVKVSPSVVNLFRIRIKRLLSKISKLAESNKVGLVTICDSRAAVADVLPESTISSFVPGWRNIGNPKQIVAKEFFQALKSQNVKEHIIEVDEKNLTALELLLSNSNLQIILRKDKFYVDAQHGLGNRLRAIASGAAIAKATDRELVVVWEPDHHCECRMSELFDYKGAVIEQSFVSEAADKGLLIFNYMEIEEGAKKDAPVNLKPGTDAYGRSAYVFNSENSDWNSENAFLRGLIPTKRIIELTSPFNVANRIGVHVRMEAGKGLDNNPYDSIKNWTKEGHAQIHYWREKSHYSRFLRRIDQILSEQKDKKIYLATDLPETYKKFEEYYGSKLSFLKRNIYDRSKEQMLYALADALLLSRCEKLLGSTWSSFSELAMRFSNTFTSIEMSGKDF